MYTNPKGEIPGVCSLKEGNHHWQFCHEVFGAKQLHTQMERTQTQGAELAKYSHVTFQTTQRWSLLGLGEQEKTL